MTALRVAICGVAGFNRGDDAIAMALAQGILAQCSQARVHVAVLAPVDFARQPAIQTFMAARSRPAGLLGLCLAIARSDLVVLGGGSLIQDKFGGGRIKGVMGYAWIVTWLAARMGKRLVTAPLGVDALHSPQAQQVAGEILGRCRQVYVRDERSRTNALAYGKAQAVQPRRIPDPAFGLPGTPQNASSDAPVVLAPAFEGENDEFIADIFVQIAAACLAASDRPVVIIAMDDRQEQDAGKLSMIIDRLPQDLRSRVSIAIPSGLSQTVPLIRRAAGIIAMRLHAMILGYGFAPMSCLSRTTKTDAFMEDFHVPGVSLEAGLDTAQIASRLVNGMLQWREREQQELRRAKILEELDSYYADIVLQAQPGKA